MGIEGGGLWVQVNPFVHTFSNGAPPLAPLLLSSSFKLNNNIQSTQVNQDLSSLDQPSKIHILGRRQQPVKQALNEPR